MNAIHTRPIDPYAQDASAAVAAFNNARRTLRDLFAESPEAFAERLGRWADQYREQQPSYASDIEAALDRHPMVGRG